MRAPRSLGVFSALLLSSPATAADAPVQLSYAVVKAKTGWAIEVYAQNPTKKVVNVDDNPFISDAKLLTATGNLTEIGTQPDYDMMSRAGPRRRWMAVQPGERILVGTTPILLPEGASLDVGSISFDVRVTTPEGESTVHAVTPVSKPTS